MVATSVDVVSNYAAADRKYCGSNYVDVFSGRFAP